MAHRERIRFEEKYQAEPNTGCWLWTATRNWAGYGQFWMGGRLRGAHRAAWEIYNEEIPKGMFVLHQCDTPSCVNPDHLFLGTQRDNMRDMRAKKRGNDPRRNNARRGEGHPKSPLTEYAVREIRRRAANESQRSLGREFGVDQSAISRLVRGVSWAHV